MKIDEVRGALLVALSQRYSLETQRQNLLDQAQKIEQQLAESRRAVEALFNQLHVLESLPPADSGPKIDGPSGGHDGSHTGDHVGPHIGESDVESQHEPIP